MKKKKPIPKEISEAAALIGRLGGFSKSKAKQEASRKNGASGGRPKNKKARQ